MPKKSAGILMFRQVPPATHVLLVHPGGPFWSKRDLGAWSIPKGEYDEGEAPEAAARREFHEETGIQPAGALMTLGNERQRSGKIVSAFALQGDFDPLALRSNLFDLEWPPHSGRIQSFPEVDRAGWFSVAEARHKIVAGQRPFLDRLEALLSVSGPESPLLL